MTDKEIIRTARNLLDAIFAIHKGTATRLDGLTGRKAVTQALNDTKDAIMPWPHDGEGIMITRA